MKRPLLPALVFLLAGIIAGANGVALVLVALCALIFSFAFCLWYRRGACLLYAALAVSGMLLVQNQLTPKNAELEQYVAGNGNATIEARVVAVSQTGSGRAKLRLRTIAISTEGNTYEDRLIIQAILPSGERTELGQRVVIEGQLLQLDFARNPGAYDEFTYLRTRGIEYTIYPDTVEAYDIFVTPPMYLQYLANRMAEVYDSAFNESQASILKAMILGDKSGLDDTVSSLYKNTGIYHVLVVSGLHISILALFIKKLLSPLGMKASGIVALIFLAMYCILTGGSAATVRAAIMFATAMIGELIGRERDSASSIALAAVLLLLYQPLYLWDVGFIYSFAMVIGIRAGAPFFTQLRKYILKKFPASKPLLDNALSRGYLCGALAAFVISIPISAYYFYEISVVALIANLLILPLIEVVVALGFIVGVAGILVLPMAKMLAVIVSLILSFNEVVCTVLLKLPFAVLLTGKPRELIILLYLAILLILYISIQKEKLKNTLRFGASALVLALGVVLILPQSGATVAFLDVGQGDSAVISTANASILIDGGGLWYRDIGNNTGVNDVAPYLNYLGVSKLDAAIVTHNDADHALGVIELVQAGRVKMLIMSDAASDESSIYYQLLEAAEQSRTEISYISAGAELNLGELSLYCLSPENEAVSETNNASLVFRMSYGDIDVLFTGDMEAAVERSLLVQNAGVGAEILKVAHHGSSSSSTEEFLDAVAPELAVISSGANNIYGHPSDTVLERLTQRDIPYLNTAVCGAVICEIKPGSAKMWYMGELDKRLAR